MRAIFAPVVLAFALFCAPAMGAEPVTAIDWDKTPVRLLMMERDGCIYCARWDAEIAPGYAASPEGKIAPLLRIDIDGPYPDGLALASKPNLTPTFILVDHGSEVDRVSGYVGRDYFYPVLREIMAKLQSD